MASEISGIRAQVLANSKIMLKTTNTNPNTKPNSTSTQTRTLNASQATLLPPSSSSSFLSSYYGDLDVVVFGQPGWYTAAVMVGLTPAIEGAQAATPEAALRKLLIATCELLNAYIPKVGAHQRNIHGGGVFDEDMVSEEIVNSGGGGGQT